MSSIVVTGTLSAAVATSGTFTVSYPARSSPEYGSHDEGSFYGSTEHALFIGQDARTWLSGFTLTFGTSNITVTNTGSATWAAGSAYRLELQLAGTPVFRQPTTSGKRTLNRANRLQVVQVNLGAPDAAVSNGICASQTINTTGTLNGSLVSGGVAVLDVPRNVVAAWTNTATITVTGTDEYGNTMTETSGSGTSFAGKKAFARVTAVVSSVSITSATVGTGDVLGLPVYLPGTAHVIRELQDGAAATAGTTVAGITTASSATTGDVRGTYDPNAAADGDKQFTLFLALPDSQYLGPAQA